MAQRQDLRNIRKRYVLRNGKRVEVFQVRIRRCDDAGKLQTLTRTFDKLDDAIVWRNAMLSKVALGEIGDKLDRRRVQREIKLREVLNKVLEFYGTNLWHSNERRSWPNEIKILLGFMSKAHDLCNKSLADITQQDVQQYFERRLYESRKSTETVRREKTAVRYALRLAKRYPFKYDTDELLHTFHVTDLPKVVPPDRHILTPDEWHRIYDAIEKRRGKQEQLWRSLVTVAKDTGLRRGELLKLEWRDIKGLDLEIGMDTLNVRSEVSKTNKPRLLPLTGTARGTLIRYWTTLPDEYKTPTSKVFGANERVVNTFFGHKERVWGLTTSAFEQAWSRLMEDANIKVPKRGGSFRNFTFHEIRHNAETNFRRRKGYGLSGEEADYMMGHVTKGMRALYDHSNTAFPEEIVEAIRAKLDAADDAFSNEEWARHERGIYSPPVMPVEEIADIRRRPGGPTEHKQRPTSGLWPWEDGAWYGEWEEKHGKVVQKRR